MFKILKTKKDLGFQRLALSLRQFDEVSAYYFCVSENYWEDVVWLNCECLFKAYF